MQKLLTYSLISEPLRAVYDLWKKVARKRDVFFYNALGSDTTTQPLNTLEKIQNARPTILLQLKLKLFTNHSLSFYFLTYDINFQVCTLAREQHYCIMYIAVECH